MTVLDTEASHEVRIVGTHEITLPEGDGTLAVETKHLEVGTDIRVQRGYQPVGGMIELGSDVQSD